MALQRQSISVPFTHGLSLKADDKQVPPGDLLVAENVTFQTPGKARKRNGHKELSRAIEGSTETIGSGQAQMTFGDELLLADATSLYSRDATRDNWVKKGDLQSCYVTKQQVNRDGNAQTSPDGVTHSGGLSCYAWEDSSGGVRYCVIDSTTGQNLTGSTLASANGQRPKVLVFDDVFVLLWYDTSDTLLHMATVPTAVPTQAIAPFDLTTHYGDSSQIHAPSPYFDATVGNGMLYLVFANETNGISVHAHQGVAPLSAAHKAVIEARADCLTIAANTQSGGPVVAYLDASDGSTLVVVSLDESLDVLTSTSFVGHDGTQALTAVVLVSGGLSVIEVFASVSSANSYDWSVARVTTGDVGDTDHGVIVRSVGLWGKAFVYAGAVFVPLAFDTTLQKTVFVADATGRVVARMLAGNAGGLPAHAQSPCLPEVTALSATEFRFAALEAERLDSNTDGTAVYADTGVCALTLDFFDTAKSYGRAEIGRNLHIGGGMLWMYDGANLVEHGFHVFPEPVAATTNGTPGDEVNSWQYAATYEWPDAQGQIHRSAPSIAQTVKMDSSVAIGAAGVTGTVTIPKLRLTAKTGVKVKLYRTQVNVGEFLLVPSPTIASQTDDEIVYTDATTDTALAGQPPLYTTGGVLDDIPAPPCSALAVHRNRLFLVDSTNPLSVWFSGTVVPGAPVELSDAATLDIDPGGGDVTGLAELDGVLVVFKRSSVFIITGDGPNATGASNTFSDAQRVTTDCGCINPRSIVTAPGGLVYQSEKGFYLLGRDLSVTYIGANVESYNGDTVTSGQLVPTTNQVRLTLASGVALVWDYFVNQWSTFTNVAAVDSALDGDAFVYLTSDGRVREEVIGRFDDAGEPIRLRVVTGWLKFAGLQGYQRVWKAAILGSYKSPHSLRVKVAYDFGPAFVQEAIITPTPPGAWGSGATWGSDAAWGGDSGEYQPYEWRFFPQRQRCQAIQLSIEDVQTTANAGEGLDLSAIGFEIGVLPGLWRVSAAKSFG